MSAQYDNTNTVAIFGPKDSMTQIGSGRVNVEGKDLPAVLMRVVTTTGKVVEELYVKVGAVFPSKLQSEKAPQFTGPIDLPAGDLNQISLWERQDRNGNAYLQGKLSFYEKQQNGGGSSFGRGVPSRNHDLDDDIPF